MRCHLYLRKGKVFIPTFGRVPGGPYRDIEPVAVVEVSDTEGLRRAFRETIARGNPPVGPYPRPNPPPVVVKYAGVKSWGRSRAVHCLGVLRKRTVSFKSSAVEEFRKAGWKIRSKQ